MQESLDIYVGQKNALVDAIDKLNRKAVKIGCDPIALSFGEEFTVEKTTAMGRKYQEVFVPATIDYEIPIIDGWQLISTFDIYPAKDGGSPVVTTSTVPGETVPVKFADKTEIHCDHCGHNRYRTHSMLMRNVDTGEYKEVGSTCVRDFFGHDPVVFLRWASWNFMGIVGELKDEDDCFGGGGGVRYLDLEETLMYTSATIKEYGWLGKGKAWEQGFGTPTADNVLDQMFPLPNMKESEKVTIDEDDVKIAKATIKYWAENPDLENDYVNNCNKITRIGYIPTKMFGLAVSMVPSYTRTIFEIKEKERAAKLPPSEWVGTVGDRLKKIPAICVYAKNLETDFGTTLLAIFQGDDGNAYKTFYSGTKWDVYVDDKVLVTGTIKEHEEYKGKKSTMLTRCNVEILTQTEEAA